MRTEGVNDKRLPHHAFILCKQSTHNTISVYDFLCLTVLFMLKHMSVYEYETRRVFIRLGEVPRCRLWEPCSPSHLN